MILFCVPNLNAQQGISMGLGEAYTAIARGPEAIFWNPANLGLSSELPNFNFKLYSIGLNFGNNAFDLKFYDDYFTGTGQEDEEGNKIGKTLTEGDKAEILNKIPDDGLELVGRMDFSTFAFNYKNFGFSIEGNAFMETSIPKYPFEIILNGLEQKNYTFDVKGNGFGVGRINISYGRTILKNSQKRIFKKRINELAVGWTISYLKGVGYAKVTESDVNLNITNAGINAPSEVVTKLAAFGNGFGLDFGVGAVLENNWRIGLAFDNIPGIINWSDDAKESTHTFDLEREMFLDEFDDIEFEDYEETIDKDLDSFSQTLPLNVRFGVAKFYKRFIANFGVAREYEHIRFSLGGGIDLKIIDLYVSYGRIAGDHSLSGAVAFNYKHFLWDIGIISRGGMTQSNSKAIAIGSSLRFGF